MSDYTALAEMRDRNREKYGIDGPLEPPPIPWEDMSGELERLALSFIREDCRELRFARDGDHMALADHDGRSSAPGQLPLNMERDLDRACMERAIHRFLASGSANDAFDVYFCYLEMFVGSYKSSRKMIELLSEFEVNASSLLMKHRDHYSHSVYVFLLGLALYRACPPVREAYAAFYGLGEKAAHHFLEYWGLTALFHDIGYPFELPFEEIKSYFGDTVKGVPYVAYKGTADLTLPREALARLLREAPEDLTPFRALAECMTDRFWPGYRGWSGYRGFLTENGLTDNREAYCRFLESILRRKPENPRDFGGFMDHAVFSALMLLRKLTELIPDTLSPAHGDALTAIALHNSMYRYALTNVKPKTEEDIRFSREHRLRAETHPLAWLLMLCDELQCWDRVAYGQNSRRQFHPFSFDLEAEGDRLRAVYRYDAAFEGEKRDTGTYAKMRPGPDGDCGFLRDILDILDPGSIALEVKRELRPLDRRSSLYLSTSSFMHLYDFALTLNAQYSARDYDTGEFRDVPPEKMEADFDRLSLEYKLSNIAQAKAFGGYLDALGCFFTDRQVAYPMKRSFTEAELETIGRMEHDRWDREKEAMGWQFGTAYDKLPREERTAVRERTRTHKLLNVPYEDLGKVEQKKDTVPMNDMMRLLENYDGLRIYSLR